MNISGVHLNYNKNIFCSFYFLSFESFSSTECCGIITLCLHASVLFFIQTLFCSSQYPSSSALLWWYTSRCGIFACPAPPLPLSPIFLIAVNMFLCVYLSVLLPRLPLSYFFVVFAFCLFVSPFPRFTFTFTLFAYSFSFPPLWFYHRLSLLRRYLWLDSLIYNFLISCPYVLRRFGSYPSYKQKW